ncbi:unnamed protein product, partial [Brachionus calyciflorus]
IFTTGNKVETFSDMCNERFVAEYIQKFKGTRFNHKIDIERLIKIIKELPNNKSSGMSGVCYEMIKYSENRNIFETIINQQETPYLFNLSMIKPLVKDAKKTNSDISNLRPAAISDAISNLFESILLDMLNEHHNDHPKQFGFKQNSSCKHAIWALKQAIEISKFKGKWIYICAIDASKAFDKVNRTLLWRILIEKNFSPHIVLSIINYYKDSLLLINNLNKYSTIFKSLVGVRQDGKVSPKLFSIFIEKIIEKISKSDLGIKLNKIKMDILAYADDLLLISSNKKELQEMLDIVTETGRELEIKFNPEKTLYTVLNKKTIRKRNEKIFDRWQDKLTLDECEIEEVNCIKYLGVEIVIENDDKRHIEKSKRAALTSLARLRTLEILTDKTDSYLRGHLNKTHIMPVLFYGAETIKLTRPKIISLKKIEGKIMRSIYGLPKSCRTLNLKLIKNLNDTSKRLKLIQINFFERLLKNEYTSEVINDLLQNNVERDYIECINEILSEVTYEREIGIIEKCKYFRYVQNLEFETIKQNNQFLNNLKEIFKKQDK